jgi:hypothetical protein
MNFFLILVAVVATLFGFSTLGVAKSAIHEISAYLCFMIALMAIVSVAILGRLDDIKQALRGKEVSKPRSTVPQDTQKVVEAG